MYSTCLFCHASLGLNEAVEHFTVGRRLAFDAAKGRLWVVCERCARWNLTPLEERWEAIEDCERLFRDSRLRVATDQIGLARLREGTMLIRIGAPQKPEMAAWRYGDQFGRRQRRYIMLVGTAAVVGVGAMAIGPYVGLTGGALVNAYEIISAVRGRQPAVRLKFDDRPVLRLNRNAIDQVELGRNLEYGYELQVPLVRGWGERLARPWRWRRDPPEVLTITGDDAVRAARVLLPAVNASGGRAATVRRALDLLEATPRVHELFTWVAHENRHRRQKWWSPRIADQAPELFGNLTHLPAPHRLALEMALHEDDERRALGGELAELEARWKEAEEIAAISDDLLVPSSIVDRIRGPRRS